MIKSTLQRTYRSQDHIHVYTTKDTSLATVQHWQRDETIALNNATTPRKHLYDLRSLTDLSVYALHAAIKLKAHPNANNIYTAILATHDRVIEMADLVMRIQPGGHFRLFADETKAVEWLNSQVPVQDEISLFFTTAYFSRQTNR